MPRVSEFYGIAIYMYFNDHGTPHFHAVYGGQEAVLSIRVSDSLKAACRSGRLLSSGRGASYTEKNSNGIGTWHAQAALSGGSRRWSEGSTR